eukprot:11442763-Prorocentrum_lima.AAC.1
MTSSLVGSEMCIRDRCLSSLHEAAAEWLSSGERSPPTFGLEVGLIQAVSYTHLTLPTICSV